MFGNKYAGADIAEEMYGLLNKSKPVTQVKKASKENAADPAASLKSEAIASPEDFLVSPETDSEDVGATIDNKISDMSSYLKDYLCDKHNSAKDSCGCQASKAEDSMSAGSLIADSFADDGSYDEDQSYLVDAKAKFILEGLGKVAKSLNDKNEKFAADLVEATAIGIRNDYLKKASRKMSVVNSLEKMASNFYEKGNELAGDMVTVTVNKIKKNS